MLVVPFHIPSTTAWQNGHWLEQRNVTISLDDYGFLQAATIVERMRTCHGVPLDVARHLQRFCQGCAALGIPPAPDDTLQSVVAECSRRNAPAFGESDFSIVLLATPGRLSDVDRQPTRIAYPIGIDWQQLSRWYTSGQSLFIADSRNVPAQCWSPTIKTRARLQYFLADAAVAKLADQCSGAVLLDLQGNITETSVANLIIVEGKRLVSPPLTEILNGISLERTLRLGQAAGWNVVYEPVSLLRAEQSDEILLCGSTACLWPASRIGARVFEGCSQGRAFISLAELWCEDLGLDFIQQAKLLSTTVPH